MIRLFEEPGSNKTSHVDLLKKMIEKREKEMRAFEEKVERLMQEYSGMGYAKTSQRK